jgi:hypothetical protein
MRQELLGLKTLLAFALLLASCGRSPDPPFTSQSGDLGIFLFAAISSGGPQLEVSNRLATSWNSRVLTDRHRSGEYLDGRRALQVATARTNFVFVESLLTQQLGSPSLPMREEQGWRHVGWSRSNPKLGVWLIEVADQCRIEIVTETSKDGP